MSFYASKKKNRYNTYKYSGMVNKFRTRNFPSNLIGKPSFHVMPANGSKKVTAKLHMDPTRKCQRGSTSKSIMPLPMS